MKAVGVVRHLFYTSKIQFIHLERNHLIYKHVYFKNTVDTSENKTSDIYIYIYIRNESCGCG